jgi:hypothetical protein
MQPDESKKPVVVREPDASKGARPVLRGGWDREVPSLPSSKAFTRESDQEDDDDIAPPGVPGGTRNYITPQGYARLRAELLDLIDNERPKVVEAVHWAARNGDRSENGDYLYGKKRLREIDRRIRFLTKRLEIAEVTDPVRLRLRSTDSGGSCPAPTPQSAGPWRPAQLHRPCPHG